MNIRTKLAAGVLAFGLATAGYAAQTGNTARGRMGGHLFGRAAQALNLTDTQKEFAKQLRADTRDQAKPVAEKLRENRQAIAAAVKANDQAAITRLTQQQGELAGQLSAIRAKSMASFYAQLTPEQRTKADEIHSKFAERANNRRAKRSAQ